MALALATSDEHQLLKVVSRRAASISTVSTLASEADYDGESSDAETKTTLPSSRAVDGPVRSRDSSPEGLQKMPRTRALGQKELDNLILEAFFQPNVVEDFNSITGSNERETKAALGRAKQALLNMLPRRVARAA